MSLLLGLVAPRGQFLHDELWTKKNGHNYRKHTIFSAVNLVLRMQIYKWVSPNIIRWVYSSLFYLSQNNTSNPVFVFSIMQVYPHVLPIECFNLIDCVFIKVFIFLSIFLNVLQSYSPKLSNNFLKFSKTFLETIFRRLWVTII